MTSANMLTRLRTLLDEASASFYADTELYSALADGQRQITAIALSLFDRNPSKVPEIIRPLIKTASGTLAAAVSTISLPADYLRYITGKYIHNATSGGRPVFLRAIDGQLIHKQNNAFQVADTGEEYYITIDTAINLETATVSPGGYYSITYFSTPADIASGANPTLSDSSHNAIIQYALYFILRKDQKEAESASALNVFQAQIQEIMI